MSSFLCLYIFSICRVSLHEISYHCRHPLLAVKPRGLIRWAEARKSQPILNKHRLLLHSLVPYHIISHNITIYNLKHDVLPLTQVDVRKWLNHFFCNIAQPLGAWSSRPLPAPSPAAAGSLLYVRPPHYIANIISRFLSHLPSAAILPFSSCPTTTLIFFSTINSINSFLYFRFCTRIHKSSSK